MQDGCSGIFDVIFRCCNVKKKQTFRCWQIENHMTEALNLSENRDNGAS